MTTFTVRRDANGHACAIERDGKTILHLAIGTELNEENAPKVAFELYTCYCTIIYAQTLRKQRDELLDACKRAVELWRKNSTRLNIDQMDAAIANAKPQTDTPA